MAKAPKPLCSYCKERPVYARDFCQHCYNRARRQERLTGQFDPARQHRPHRGGPVVCASCGRLRKHCARGLCRTCWVRGKAREKAGKGFSPERAPSQGSLPRLLLSETAFDIMKFLADSPELSHRRFKSFGADLARKIGVSREYIRQVLLKLQRHDWISYHLRLSPEARAAFEMLKRERNGQLSFPWAWSSPVSTH